MPATLRIALPHLLMAAVGAALILPAGRVATGLCDFEASALCREHAGATWIWLVFVGALVLGGAGIWRLATLRRRLDDRALRPASGAEPAPVPVETAARRLTAVSQPRTEAPIAAALPAPAADPVPADEDQPEGIDEFVWLKAQLAIVRAFIAAHWNWAYDLEMLQWLVEQPDCDGGIAAGVCWRALSWDMQDETRANIARSVAHRFARGRVPVRYAFDDSDADSLHAAALRANATGAIDWNPALLPVRSSGAKLTIADLPASARPAVRAFLRHIGGGAISSV